MTINQAIYIIRERVSQYSADSSISNREILFELDLARAEYYNSLLKNNRYRKLSESSKQIICIELEEVSNSECGCTEEDCTILRSTKTIPTAISDKVKVSSGKYDAIAFDSVSWSKFIYSGYSKYSKDVVYAAFRSDNHIYIKSNNPLHKVIPCVYVSASFENPAEAAEFKFEDGTSCYDKDTTNYPMSAGEFSVIKEIVIKKMLNELKVPEDNINNANDDIKG